MNGVCARVGRRGETGGTNVDWVYITIVIRIHVTIGEEAVGEKREKNEFRQR